jgi:uncharacterized protein YbjT (DUF2867 family)/CRP-like cAMP-binding protein
VGDASSAASDVPRSVTPVAGAPAGGRVLVFGATGYIGSHLVPRLLREGFAVRACARNRKLLESRGWAGAELVEADALQPATLGAALQGVDTAYYLVHSMAAGRDFGRLDLEAAGHFAAAAAAAGVRRIVYLGGLIPADPDSEHLISRRDTGVRLRQGAVPVTELRAGIIVGPGSAAYEVIRDLVNHLPVMLTPKWVRSRSAPIALDNLLEYLVRLPWIEAAAGQVYDAAGADTLSYEDVMRQYGAAVGKRPIIVRVPLPAPRRSTVDLHQAAARVAAYRVRHAARPRGPARKHTMNNPDAVVYEAVKASRLAEGLDEQQVSVLARLLRLQAVQPQELLAREGNSDNRLYVVVQGSLVIVKHLGTPDETTLATLQPGDFAHELGFLDGAARYASLQAASAGQVLVLEREQLESLIDSQPRILYAVMCAIVRTVHRVQTRLAMQASELTNYVVKQHGRY